MEGDTVKVSFDDITPIGAEAPNHVELEITYTEPGIKGDTATNTLKPATVETGAQVNVPLFVDSGDSVFFTVVAVVFVFFAILLALTFSTVSQCSFCM